MALPPCSQVAAIKFLSIGENEADQNLPSSVIVSITGTEIIGNRKNEIIAAIDINSLLPLRLVLMSNKRRILTTSQAKTKTSFVPGCKEMEQTGHGCFATFNSLHLWKKDFLF